MEKSLPETFLENQSCNYYDEESFNNMSQTINHKLLLFNLNIRSIYKHADELHVYLDTLNVKFDFTGLTEFGNNTNINMHGTSTFDDLCSIFYQPCNKPFG